MVWWTEERIPVFGQHDDEALNQIRDVNSRALRTALMADGHPGYIMPIGGVAAYDNKVSVAGVGYDIACGNIAIRTDDTVEVLDEFLSDIADDIQFQISFGVGRTNDNTDAPTDHTLFEADQWNIIPLSHRGTMRELARDQLGTVGSGNHYVDVFVDGADQHIWVGCHFGSRGFGHKIATAFMALAAGKQWGERVKEAETLLDLNTQLGQDYWDLMQLAGQYAYAGRAWVARHVVENIIGAHIHSVVHNNHNFAWRETHELTPGDERNLVVVRKGATPAWPGQYGFIGGSMGDNAVIVRGAEQNANTDLQKSALFSTVHGAGRVMSRRKAKGKVHRKTGRVLEEGEISRDMMDSWLQGEQVLLRGGDLDEAPQAYRRLPDVLQNHEGTIEILHTLRPLIVVMAGEGEYDPYRD